MPLIYHEGYSLGDGAGNNQLLKDTVGWTGKNLLKNTASSRTINGVTFTVNSDGTIIANGTATASVFLDIPISLPIGEYVFSGTNNQSGGSPSKYYARLRKSGGIQFATSEISPLPVQSVDGSEIKFKVLQDNLDIRYQICIYPAAGAVSNLTFYPMIRRADIIDDTYEPYHESVENVVEQVYADNGVLGAKNLLKNALTSQTINGVTFTVNSDGSITANGTCTSQADLKIASNNKIPININSKSFIISGCPDGGSTDYSDGKHHLFVAFYSSDSATTIEVINSKDVLVNLDFIPESIRYGVSIHAGGIVSNLIFKPMLRLASDPDDTYQPYAMTNRELTEKAETLKSVRTWDSTTGIVLFKYGNIVTVNFDGMTVVTKGVDEAFFTLPEGYRPRDIIQFVEPLNNRRIVISTNGQISSKVALNNAYIRGYATFIVM